MAQDIEAIFEKSGALLKGHFLLTSGLHSPVYWEKALVLQYPRYTEQLCSMIAENYRDRGIQVVAGPTTTGIIVAYEVARQLGVRSIFAERDPEKRRVFRRGFSIGPSERVLVVDDILTTGGSIRDVVDAVRNLGGDIVGIGILIDRSPQKVDFGFPLYSCHRAETVTFTPEECPLCAEGIPLVKPGSSQPPSA